MPFRIQCVRRRRVSSLTLHKKRLEVLDTNQVIVLGRLEIDFIRRTASDLLRQHANDPDAAAEAYLKRKDVLANLKALRLAAGLEAALFGRMVTSDILARGDGAVHVAHALTVHAEEAEPDYFVAIDGLTCEAGELGTGLIQDCGTHQRPVLRLFGDRLTVTRLQSRRGSGRGMAERRPAPRRQGDRASRAGDRDDLTRL